MSALAEFLLARIAEDERSAQAVADSHAMWDWESYVAGAGMYEEPASDYAQRMNPARVLAECAAKRAIVEEARALINSFGDWDAEVGAPALWPDVTRRERSQAHGRLHALANVYADHPDYRDEWRA